MRARSPTQATHGAMGCTLLVLASLAHLLQAHTTAEAESHAPAAATTTAATAGGVAGTSWVGLPCDRKSAVKSSISEAMSETEADPLEIIKLGKLALLEQKQRELQMSASQPQPQQQLVPVEQGPLVEVKERQVEPEKSSKQKSNKSGDKKKRHRKKNKNKRQPKLEDAQKIIESAPLLPVAMAGVQERLPLVEAGKAAGEEAHLKQLVPVPGPVPIPVPVQARAPFPKRARPSKRAPFPKRAPIPSPVQASELTPVSPDHSEHTPSEHTPSEHTPSEHPHEEELAEEQVADSPDEAESSYHSDGLHPSHVEDSHSVVDGDDHHTSHMDQLPSPSHHPSSFEHSHHDSIPHSEHTFADSRDISGGPSLLPSGPPPGSHDSTSYHQELMDDMSLKHSDLPLPGGSEMHHHMPPSPDHHEYPTPIQPHLEADIEDDEENREPGVMDNFSELPGFSGSLPEMPAEDPHQGRHFNRHSRRQYYDDHHHYGPHSEPEEYESERKYVDELNPHDPYQVHEREQERRHRGRFGGSQERHQSSYAYSLKNPRNYRRRYASSKSSYSGNRFNHHNKPGYLRGSPIYAPLSPLAPITTFAAIQPALIYEGPMHQQPRGHWKPAGYPATAAAAATSSGPFAFASSGAQQQPAGYYATSAFAGLPLLYDPQYEDLAAHSYPKRRMSKGQRYRANKQARKAAAAAAAATSGGSASAVATVHPY